MKTSYNYYLTSNKDNKLFLCLDAIKDNSFYSIVFQIGNNSLALLSVEKDHKDYHEILKKIVPKKIEVTDNTISIDLDCHFKFSDDDIIDFNVNKVFNKDDIFKNRYETYKKSNKEFKIKYIEDAYSTKGYKNYLYQNIEEILNLTNKIEKESSKLIKNQDITNKYNYLSKDTSIKLAQNFLDKYDIDFNINEEINNSNIIFSDIKGNSLGHYSTKDNVLYAYNKDNIVCPAILIHELMHYYNERSNTDEYMATKILTEAVAYTYEFIFLYEMLNTSYSEDIINFYKSMMYTLYRISYSNYPTILSVELMKKYGHINEEILMENSLYKNYEHYIKEIEESIKADIDYAYDLKTIIGMLIATKNLKNYINDNNYINTIKEFNDSISTEHTIECLKILGINSLEDIYNICDNELIEVFDIMTNNEVKKEKVKTKKLENTI